MMGLAYHRQMNIIIAVLTAVYTLFGLFLRTSAQTSTANATNFSRRLTEISGSGTSNVANTVQHAHLTQANYYDIALLLVTMIYLVALFFVAMWFIHRQETEIGAYLGAGKRSLDVASQFALEGGISAAAGFSVVAVTVSLFSQTLGHWCNSINQYFFVHTINRAPGANHHELMMGIKTMMTNHMTDFNPQSLLRGTGNPTAQMPTGITGFALVGVYAIGSVIIVNLLVTAIQAHNVRRQLN